MGSHVHTFTIDKRMKPAAAASIEPSGEYTNELTEDVVNTSPAPRKPTIYRPSVLVVTQETCLRVLTATWYVYSASAATVIVTPTMAKNMKTNDHHE
jgi:hypothetical protein